MMKLKSYINIRNKNSKISATDDTVHQIVFDEIQRFGVDADLNHIDVSKVTTFCNNTINDEFNGSVFDNNKIKKLIGCENREMNLIDVDISKWDVSNCKDFSNMFYHCQNFKCDLSNWDVSSAETMKYMFTDCRSFNSDLSRWDMSKVRDMSMMFSGCVSFDFNTIANWDVENVTCAISMFSWLGDTLSKQKVDLSNLYFAKIPKKDRVYGTFYETTLVAIKRPFISDSLGNKSTFRLN